MALKISLFNSTFSSPLFLASGILGSTLSSLRRVYQKGAALVITKSIGVTKTEGYSNPVTCGNEHYLINSIGLANPGIDHFVEEAKQDTIDFPFVGSIFGKDENDFSMLAQKMESIKATAVELNISCPHAKKGLGLAIASDLELVKRVVKKTTDSIDISVSVKIPPLLDLNYLQKLVDVIVNAGARVIVATNTMPGMSIDLYSHKSVLSNVFGGVSGPALKPISLRTVFEIKKMTNIDVVGVGGVLTAQDVLEYMMAGASAVQIGSAIYYREIDVFNKIKEELYKLLEDLGFSSVKEVICLAHKN